MDGKVRLKSVQEKLIWAEAVPFHGLCPWSATYTSSLPASRFWHSWKYLYLKVRNYTLFSANQVTKPVSCCLHIWWDLIPANLLADEAQIVFSHIRRRTWILHQNYLLNYLPWPVIKGESKVVMNWEGGDGKLTNFSRGFIPLGKALIPPKSMRIE